MMRATKGFISMPKPLRAADVSPFHRERFWARVQKEDGCWIWTAGTCAGYGQFWMNGQNYRAHRLSYALRFGESPSHLVLDHICRNRGCVNPDHLRPVLLIDNVLLAHPYCTQRGEQFVITHCRNGHQFTPENTGQAMMRGKRYRICRQCNRDKSKRHYEKAKQRSAGL